LEEGFDMSEITDLIMRIRNSDMPLATQKELERAYGRWEELENFTP